MNIVPKLHWITRVDGEGAFASLPNQRLYEIIFTASQEFIACYKDNKQKSILWHKAKINTLNAAKQECEKHFSQI